MKKAILCECKKAAKQKQRSKIVLSISLHNEENIEMGKKVKRLSKDRERDKSDN